MADRNVLLCIFLFLFICNTKAVFQRKAVLIDGIRSRLFDAQNLTQLIEPKHHLFNGLSDFLGDWNADGIVDMWSISEEGIVSIKVLKEDGSVSYEKEITRLYEQVSGLFEQADIDFHDISSVRVLHGVASGDIDGNGIGDILIAIGLRQTESDDRVCIVSLLLARATDDPPCIIGLVQFSNKEFTLAVPPQLIDDFNLISVGDIDKNGTFDIAMGPFNDCGPNYDADCVSLRVFFLNQGSLQLTRAASPIILSSTTIPVSIASKIVLFGLSESQSRGEPQIIVGFPNSFAEPCLNGQSEGIVLFIWLDKDGGMETQRLICGGARSKFGIAIYAISDTSLLHPPIPAPINYRQQGPSIAIGSLYHQDEIKIFWEVALVTLNSYGELTSSDFFRGLISDEFDELQFQLQIALGDWNGDGKIDIRMKSSDEMILETLIGCYGTRRNHDCECLWGLSGSHCLICEVSPLVEDKDDGIEIRTLDVKIDAGYHPKTAVYSLNVVSEYYPDTVIALSLSKFNRSTGNFEDPNAPISISDFDPSNLTFHSSHAIAAIPLFENVTTSIRTAGLWKINTLSCSKVSYNLSIPLMKLHNFYPPEQSTLLMPKNIPNVQKIIEEWTFSVVVWNRFEDITMLHWFSSVPIVRSLTVHLTASTLDEYSKNGRVSPSYQIQNKGGILEWVYDTIMKSNLPPLDSNRVQITIAGEDSNAINVTSIIKQDSKRRTNLDHVQHWKVSLSRSDVSKPFTVTHFEQNGESPLMAFSTFIEEKHDSPTLPEEFPVATVVYLTESNPLESEWTPFKSDWILKDGKRLNAIIQAVPLGHHYDPVLIALQKVQLCVSSNKSADFVCQNDDALNIVQHYSPTAKSSQLNVKVTQVPEDIFPSSILFSFDLSTAIFKKELQTSQIDLYNVVKLQLLMTCMIEAKHNSRKLKDHRKLSNQNAWTTITADFLLDMSSSTPMESFESFDSSERAKANEAIPLGYFLALCIVIGVSAVVMISLCFWKCFRLSITVKSSELQLQSTQKQDKGLLAPSDDDS